MATDIRTNGGKWRPYHRWKRWSMSSEEPEGFTETTLYSPKSLGRYGSIDSFRSGPKKARLDGYLVVRNRRGQLKKVPRARCNYGARKTPHPMTHFRFHSMDSSWHDHKVKAWYNAWERHSGQLPAMCLAEMPGLPSELPGLAASVDSGLYQQASANTFDAYTQVGEMLETLAMLKNPLAGLREAGTALWHKMRKATKKQEGEDLLQAVSGAWLEYAFGISPLITGTAEIASNLVDALNPVPSKYRKVSDYAAHTDETRLRNVPKALSKRVALFYDKTVTDQHVVNGGMWLCNDQQAFSRPAQMGLDSMRSIVGQAWALMPLSFAVDWFVGVGPLLDECRPVRGKILSTYRTYTLRRLTEIQTLYMVDPAYGVREEIYGHGRQTYQRVTRITSVSPPGMIQLGPGLFSLSQGMSLAALSAAPLQKLWRKMPWH